MLPTPRVLATLLCLVLIRSITCATSVEGIFAFDKSATKSICSSISCAFDGSSSTIVAERIGPYVGCRAGVWPLGSVSDGLGGSGARIIGCCFSGSVLYRMVDGFKADALFDETAGFSIRLVGSEW